MKTRKAEKGLPKCTCGQTRAAELHEITCAVMEQDQPFHTPTPWSVGRLLITAHTRNWSVIEKVAGETEERKRIFSNFHADDEGRSRRFIAECQSPEDAAFIVRACNAYTEMSNAIAWIEKEIEENGQGQLPDALCTFIRKIAEGL